MTVVRALRPVGLVAALLLAVFTLTRIGLLLLAGPSNIAASQWPMAFAKGLWFDAATIAFMLAPVLLYEALLPARWRTGRLHRALRFGWLWFSVGALLFLMVAEIVFWLEFWTRFNFIAVDYLIYTQEVIGNVRESYPVGPILTAIALGAVVLAWPLWRMIERMDRAPGGWPARALCAALALVLPALALMANVDQMQGSGNNYADELAGNGVFSFAAALRRNELDYQRFYRTMPQPVANQVLQSLGVEREPLTQAIHHPDDDLAEDEVPFSHRPSNVVLISVESLSASFLGAYGSTAGLTPHLDALAAGGMRFQNMYATGTRTVRGLEALSLGTPPVPGQSIVRRPRNEHLSTIGEVLIAQGMDTWFFYGGYGYFDNMNAYFDSNAYHVVDRTAFPSEAVVFENVWGVADEVLFDQALATLDRAHTAGGKPFFAHIMTTSNHRPYTYPDGRIDIPSPGGRNGAVKYTDYAIGKFIRDARAKSWFDDTVFVIVADHCASVAGKSRLPVADYRIPAIFYAPALLKPSVYQPVVSQIDLMPTLIEVLGRNGDNHFFGRSIFEAGPPLERAFISNYQELGYLRDGTLTVLAPRRKVESYRIDPVTYEATPSEPVPQLVDEATAYYQTASAAFARGAMKLRAPPR